LVLLVLFSNVHLIFIKYEKQRSNMQRCCFP
jgi:hypothetical protein